MSDGFIKDPPGGPAMAGVYLKAALLAHGGEIVVTRAQIISENKAIEIDGDGVGDVTLRLVDDNAQ